MTDNPAHFPNESDSQPCPEKPWYRLSPGAWVFLGFLLFLNGLNLLFPGVLGTVFRNMDIRLWPGRYFAVLGAALFLSVVWYWGTSRIHSTTGKENQS